MAHHRHIVANLLFKNKEHAIKLKTQHQLKTRIHTTAKLTGEDHGNHPIKNFKDFLWPNQVTTFEHYKLPQDLLDKEFNYPVWRDTMGIRWPGYWFKRKFVHVKEMEPELVVPDLTDFELKPYVSYRAKDVNNNEFTAQDLFMNVYHDKIRQDYTDGKLQNYEVSSEEIDQARLSALQTGADLFEDYTNDGVRAVD